MIKDLKIGEISVPFESQDNEGRGNTIYKIIRLEEIVPSHRADVDKDFVAVQNFAHSVEQEKAIKRFIEEKQKSTFIRIDEMFRDCPFQSKGWVK